MIKKKTIQLPRRNDPLSYDARGFSPRDVERIEEESYDEHLNLLPTTEDYIYNLDLEREIFRLTPGEATVLAFRALGFNYKEISKITGISIGRVENYTQKLKKRFAKRNIGES